MTSPDSPPGTKDLARSAVFAIRQTWQADRRGLVQVVLIQFTIAAGIAGVLLLVRDLLGDVLAFSGGTGATRAEALIPGMIVMIALGCVGSVLQVINTARQRILATNLDRHLIAKVLNTASSTQLSEFEHPRFHDRLQRAVSASRHEPAMAVVMMAAMLEVVLTIVAVVGVFIVMAWWLLPLTILSALPVLKAARDERDARYGLHYALGENRRRRQYYERVLTGRDEAKEVRALHLGPTLRDRWDAEYGREVGETVTVTRTHMWLKIKARVTGDLIVTLIVAGIWWLVGSGTVDLSTAVAGLTGLWLLSGRIQVVAGMLNSIGESILYLQDLRTFIAAADRAPVSAEPTGDDPAAVFAGMRADRISFTYPGSTRPVLNEVSMTLGAGEVVALVGANGSGKTTLAKILAGLYSPDAGCLRHGSARISDLDSLRQVTTVVFQDFTRYKVSAWDNIAFGRPHDTADRHGVERAARHAGAHQFIEHLPDGYDTVLSKEFTDGADLSGGQWQRLALARAFYRDSPFVILDEPTAALDPQAEADLFDSIRDLFQGRTVLLISHRFSSVRSADRIYVLDGGQVVEQGTHASLMRDKGTYAHLFQLQATPYQEMSVTVS